jgi:hypothetical protein
VLTIQERWRFESIPNKLVIYSTHKPHSPIKWAIDHQWHYPGKRRGTNWGRSTQGPPDCQESGLACPWAHSSCPCHTPFSINTRTCVDPNRIMPLASRSKGTLFGQLNVRHTFNMTKGTSNDRSLTDTEGNYEHPRSLSGCLQLFRPVSNYPSTLGYF